MEEPKKFSRLKLIEGVVLVFCIIICTSLLAKEANSEANTTKRNINNAYMTAKSQISGELCDMPEITTMNGKYSVKIKLNSENLNNDSTILTDCLSPYCDTVEIVDCTQPEPSTTPILTDADN